MQTIIGAGGPVSNALLPHLIRNGEPVRLVSRRPQAVSGNVSWVGADLKDYDALLKAAKGSTIIYVCAGLRYDKQVWKEEWPLIMRHLIRLAEETGARFIFFDNVYMYGRVDGPMTESTPYHPASVKGEVRAAIADALMNAAASGRIKATIARAADFYGTGGTNSFFDLMVVGRLAAGKSAQWMGDINRRHSFTYIPDAGRALAILGQQPESDNRIWHLPTAPALTGRQLVQLAADELGVAARSMKVSKLMLQGIGLFNKLIGETVEMYYQYSYDYIFDSSEFGKTFGMTATPYAEGIRAEAGRYRQEKTVGVAAPQL
jgi:nucleoside-diphosphate-sugar epimerase